MWDFKGFTWWQALFIFIAHLVLLYWIYYALHNGGILSTTELMLHFAGMATYGACLIRFCAWLAYKRYQRQQDES